MKAMLIGIIFAVLLPVSGAMAQDLATTLVSVPWGDWLSDASSTAIIIFTSVVGWAFRKLPARVLNIIQTLQLDQVLLKAIDAAINKTAGASKGRVLTVDVANEVLAKALQYAMDHGPKWMIEWAGGELALREKIIARLDVEADAALK